MRKGNVKHIKGDTVITGFLSFMCVCVCVCVCSLYYRVM